MSVQALQITVDTSLADAQIAEVNKRAEKTSRSIITRLRQVTQVGIMFAQSIGLAIDQTLALQIEQIAVSIEIAQTITAVGGLTPLGLLKLGGQLILLQRLSFLEQQLRRERVEGRAQVQSQISLLRTLTFN